jgi:hypothetical protein
MYFDEYFFGKPPEHTDRFFDEGYNDDRLPLARRHVDKLPRRKKLPDDAWLEEAAAACVYPTLPQTPVRDGSDDDAKPGTPISGRKDNVYSMMGLDGTNYTTEPITSLRGGQDMEIPDTDDQE